MRYWRNMRGRFFWRIGCFFFILLSIVIGGSATLLWLINTLIPAANVPESGMAFLRAAGILIFLLGLGGFLFAGRALRSMAIPIGDMLEAAGRVSQGDYSVRVPMRGPREARALAHAFNTMAAGLQTNDEQRRSLLADIAHELRTPLTVIQGNLEGMLDGIYPASPEHIGSILEETHALSRGLDDLRTLSLAESGGLRLQLEPVDLEELISEVVATFRQQAGSYGVALNARVQPGLPAIEIDAFRIREVLSNLILNALRYTPPGGQIDLECRLSEVGPGYLQVIVRDTGSGISPEDIPYIFDRFYKSSDSRGTGLGLAISKSLVQAHGGEISAESEVDKGTTITFSLPVSPPQPG